MPHLTSTYNPSSTSTHQLVSAANAQTYALSVTYGDWGKIQQYDLQQTDLANNLTTSVVRNYNYGSLNEGQTAFAPNSINYTDGTNVNEQYGINGSLLRRETTIPNTPPSEELYRFGADGNLRMYSYDRLFFSLYGYDGGTTRTYKYSFDLNPQWVNGRLEAVNFNLHNAMFYPNAYINFNNNGYYTKHYYNGMERIASRLGDQNLQIHTNDPELQDRKDQLDSNIRRNIIDITGYEFLPVGEEQDPDNPKPHYDLPHIGVAGLLPSADGIFYYHPNHLGSTCYVTDENTVVQQGFLYAPFGEITNEYNSGWQNGNIPKYAFNAKELDEETGMYYYEARYYQPPMFTSRDVLFEEKPWLTPYHYCSNNPVGRVDPTGMMDDWVEKADGTIYWDENATSKETTKKGETYLGKNVLVATHNRDENLDEPINSAIFELYLESDKTGPIATINGNTVPANKTKSGTLAEGWYPARFQGRAKYIKKNITDLALIINEGGSVPTAKGSPKSSMTEIFFHKGNANQKSLFDSKGNAYSEGCLIGPCYKGSDAVYDAFALNLEGFVGALYLRAKPLPSTHRYKNIDIPILSIPIIIDKTYVKPLVRPKFKRNQTKINR